MPDKNDADIEAIESLLNALKGGPEAERQRGTFRYTLSDEAGTLHAGNFNMF
jgi:hypothetical protein